MVDWVLDQTSQFTSCFAFLAETNDHENRLSLLCWWVWQICTTARIKLPIMLLAEAISAFDAGSSELTLSGQILSGADFIWADFIWSWLYLGWWTWAENDLLDKLEDMEDGSCSIFQERTLYWHISNNTTFISEILNFQHFLLIFRIKMEIEIIGTTWA